MGLHSETVLVGRVTLGDPDANGIATTTTTNTVLERCHVEQRSADEVSTTGTGGVDGDAPAVWHVSTSVIADWLSSIDRITWRGRTFTVWGKPATFYAVRPHTEFNMREE